MTKRKNRIIKEKVSYPVYVGTKVVDKLLAEELEKNKRLYEELAKI